VSGTPAGLVEDLRSAGVAADDLWELVNAKTQYRKAIPVLIDWLRNVDERVPAQDLPKVREGLVSCCWANPVATLSKLSRSCWAWVEAASRQDVTLL
jgi:hypothetical protein